jgi:hypothetical protein
MHAWKDIPSLCLLRFRYGATILSQQVLALVKLSRRLLWMYEMLGFRPYAAVAFPISQIIVFCLGITQATLGYPP